MFHGEPPLTCCCVQKITPNAECGPARRSEQTKCRLARAESVKPAPTRSGKEAASFIDVVVACALTSDAGRRERVHLRGPVQAAGEPGVGRGRAGDAAGGGDVAGGGGGCGGIELTPRNRRRVCKEDAAEILLGKRGFEPQIGLGNVLSRLQTLSPRLPPPVLDEFLELAFRTAIKNLPVDMPRMHAELREHFKKYTVLCLSAVNDNLLMWSHYADHHRGVVLRFACLEEPDSSWSVAEPIVYSAKMPRFVDQDELRNLFVGQADLRRDVIVKRTILTKAEDWKYEREWRVYNFAQTYAAQFLSFNPEELAAVYFGCRASETDQVTIMEAAQKVNRGVEFYVARKAGRAFAIEFERLM